ncbi:hypothetical protein OK016_12970 [Vibrio chagasii]|nr:hypothetical protein [Vibrio chagasii]
MDDSLPSLSPGTENLGMRFDLVLVSAVWMHLTVISSEHLKEDASLSRSKCSNLRYVTESFMTTERGMRSRLKSLSVCRKTVPLLVRHVDDSQEQRSAVRFGGKP